MKKQIKVAYFPSDTKKNKVLGSNGKSLDKYCIKCESEEDLSTGNYVVDLTFLIQDNIQDLLQEEVILKILMDYGSEIFRISKVIVGTRYINVVARQITISDSLTLWIEDVRPFKMNGKEAVSWLINNSQGTKEIQIFSDIDSINTAYYQRMNLYKALHDSDNSFISRWGGEVQRRGYNIYINSRIGIDRGFTIREGKNLVGFECNSNIDKLVTRAIGQGFNGIFGNYIDSPLIDMYNRVYTGIIKYDDVKVKEKNDDDGYDTLEEAQAELDRRIEEEFSKNGLDKMRASYTISFIQLEKTEEYKNYVQAESLLIGDECRVYIPKLNVDIRVRAVTKKFDVLAQRTKEIKLNDYVENKPLSFRQIAEKVANTDSEVINYKLINKIYYFNTINDMKKFRLLNNGDYVKVLGYYDVDDGGGANYIIDEKEYEWSIPLDRDLFANITEPKQVNYKQFGAYLDGVNDDYEAMYKCHKYADSCFHIDSENKSIYYTCTVKNDKGIIYKKNTEPIICCSNVDLSGSTLILDDTNAAWFGLYRWGDVNSLYWDYEVIEDVKGSFIEDGYVIEMPSNDALPSNTVLRIEETPYSVRDDAGYLYSVGRRELLIHDMHGICSSPFADDWSHAGGEEINCKITDLENDETTNIKSYSVLKASYTYIPNYHGIFRGCDVLLNISADKYCSVLSASRHNATIENFIFKPKESTLHNKKYKNSMIYVKDSYNVKIRNIQGFNASGMALGEVKATSGYMVRLTNCSDVHIEDCRLQGYWGATAMDSVKNIYFYRCHINRLDTHDYCYNIYAFNCVFYHHAIQIGYGRGSALFSNCDFYYNDVPNNSYPEAYAIALNLTYGRIFEGVITLENCNIRIKDVPNNEYSLIEMYFRPEATSIVKHFNFPEIRIKNVNIISSNKDVAFSYLKIGGSRNARTGIEMPSHVYGEVVDNTVKWKFYNRGFDWGKDTGRPLTVVPGDILRVSDSIINEEGKTQFYNYRYYICTVEGIMEYNEKPNITDTEIEVGTATFKKLDNPLWKSRFNYNVGDIVVVTPSNFYEPYIFTCIQSGVSDGQFPIHTEGTVLEGSNDEVNEPDLCWWTYVCKKDDMFEDYQSNTVYNVGKKFIAEERLYEVVETITTTDLPPFETGWLKESEYGGGKLKYIGNLWRPKKWFAKGSYCVADDRVYRLDKHDGITTGILPTKGNPYCVDGDITWEYIGKVAESTETTTYEAWKPNKHFNDLQMIKVGNNVYEVQVTKTSSSVPTSTEIGGIYIDGTLPLKYYGEFPLGWRTAGNTYEEGYIISDNTFLVICTKGGVTNSSDKWGPLETASGWGTDGTYTDGECIWERLTPTKSDGIWRNSHTHYEVGKFLIISESSNMRIYEVIETTTGTVEPTNTNVDEAFLNGTTTLKYKGLENTWLSNARYNIGDIVNAGENQYKCAFDGKLVLPNKTIFENITTNLKKGYIFNFNSNTDVATRKGYNDWTVIANCCDGLVGDMNGLPSGVNYFGGANTINPLIKKIN